MLYQLHSVRSIKYLYPHIEGSLFRPSRGTDKITFGGCTAAGAIFTLMGALNGSEGRHCLEHRKANGPSRAP